MFSKFAINFLKTKVMRKIFIPKEEFKSSKPKSRPEKRKFQKKNTFTHFISLPLNTASIKGKLNDLQNQIISLYKEEDRKLFQFNDPNLFHITISMLTLENEEKKEKAKMILEKNKEKLLELINDIKFDIKFKNLGTFQYEKKLRREEREKETEKKNSSFQRQPEKNDVVFLSLHEDENYKKIVTISDILIREFIKENIIDDQELKSMNLLYDQSEGIFKAEKHHLTLFRVKPEADLGTIYKELSGFEFGNAECHSIDISTRFEYDEDRFYNPLHRVYFDKKKRTEER